MKKIIVLALLFSAVIYGGSKIYTSNTNHLAQVGSSIKTDVISVEAPATVAQGQTITFTVRTVDATNRVYGYLHDEVNGGRNSTDVLTITPLSGAMTTNGTYSVTVPSTVPVGQYRLMIYGDEFGGFTPGYDTVNVTISAAPISLNDYTDPVISAVSASAITPFGATITWTTDENSRSVVSYGVSTNYGSVKDSSGRVTSHSVTLTGLTPNTMYNYKVSARDAADNTGMSENMTFKTAAAPTGAPTITNVRGSGSYGNATMSWTTDVATHGTVEYGTTISYGKTVKTKSGNYPNRKTNHSISVRGIRATDSAIIPNTLYHYRIIAESENGEKTTSPDYTFTSDSQIGGLSVLLPTENVIWRSGGSQKIKWWSGYRQLPLEIYLAGGSLTAPIRLKSTNAGHAPFGTAAPNYTGTESITVPSVTAAPPGDNYYLSFKINNVEVGRSPAFRIAVDPGPIIVTLPTTSFKKGSIYTITWNRQDDLYGRAGWLYLVGGEYGNGGIMLTSWVGGTRRSFTWTVGANIRPGTNYKIKLMQEKDDGYYDGSQDQKKVAESASFNIVN